MACCGQGAMCGAVRSGRRTSGSTRRAARACSRGGSSRMSCEHNRHSSYSTRRLLCNKPSRQPARWSAHFISRSAGYRSAAAIASSAAVKLANAAPEDGGGAPSGVVAGGDGASHTLGPLQQQKQSGEKATEGKSLETEMRELRSTYEWPCQAESSEPHGT